MDFKSQIKSTVATGTAPLSIDSTTVVSNLNADLLDGQHASYFYPASNPNGYTNYTHPTGDGNLHVPATGTTNNGKVLTAGPTDGSLSWTTPSGGGAWGSITGTLSSQTDLQSALDGKASSTHVHGNITNVGAIGTVADLVVKTTTSGVLTTLPAGTTSQYLRGDGTWQTVSLPSGLTSGSTSTGFIQYNGTVAADGQLDGGTTAPSGTNRLNYGGYFYATRVYNAYYNDYAEFFLKDESCEPGDILMKNPNGQGYIKSTSSYNKGVVGVYSDQYAHCIGGDGQDDVEDRYAPIGLAGRVNIKVIGNIEVGDMLVSSDVPGVAMKASEFVMGTVIGKALENYSSQNIGLIEMLIVNL